MKKNLVPPHISKEAHAFYSQETIDAPDIDFTSSDSVGLLRNVIAGLWTELCNQIPFEYSFNKREIGGVNCYQVTPPNADSASAVILYVHGGSYSFGHPTLCKNIPVSIAYETGISVISIEYRLGPEHFFPAPVDDLLAVIEGLKDAFGEHINYGLVGHSAGGGLALTGALQAKARKLPEPSVMALIAPWTDVQLSGDSMLTLEAFDSNPPSREWFVNSTKAFLGEYEADNPLVSPLNGNLSGLCPTYIQQPGRDRIMSDSTRLNRRLLKEKVSSTLDIWDGMWHGFQMDPSVPEAQEANRATAEFLKNVLGNL